MTRTPIKPTPKADEFKAMASEVAKDSIVAQALARLLEQVLTEVHDTRIKPLEATVRALVAEPFGCVFCDSGKLRSPDKAHSEGCAFFMAEQVLGGAR